MIWKTSFVNVVTKLGFLFYVLASLEIRYKQNRTWSKLFWKDPKFAIWIKIILKKIKVKCVLFCFQVCCPSYTFCCNDGQKCCYNNHNPLSQIFTTLKEAPFKVLPVKEIAKPIKGIF